MKNIKAIEKIIAELAMQDFLSVNGIRKNGKLIPDLKPKINKPYSLSAETLEAREIMYDYLSDSISENEYKAFCMKYNLRTGIEVARLCLN